MKAQDDTLKPKTSPRRRTVSTKASKRMLAGFTAGTLLFAALAILTMYIVDPLQFYRKATLYEPIFSNEQRYQNPGLARNYDYDTIILGTSMTENFLPSVVDKELGGKTLKLSIRGSYAEEQYDIAQVAFRTGKVKQVLWGIDYFALKPADLDAQGPYPHYLYDDNFLNDYKYWFNVTPYQELIKGIYKRMTATDNGKRLMGLEYLYNWNYYVTYGKQYAMKFYKKALSEEVRVGMNEEPLEVVQKNFSDYIEPLIKANPDVEFKFYYPPYSILRQAVWRDLNVARYEQQLTMKQWMFDQFKKYPNVKVYDFQTEAEWTFNLNLFKDLSHHNQNVNTWIARAIGQDDPKYRVTEDNVDQFVDDLREQVEDVAVTGAGDLMRVPVRLASEPDKAVTFTQKELRGPDKLLFVPSKEAASVLGAELAWDQASKTMTVTRGDHEIVLTVGSMEATINGKAVDVPYPVELIGGKTIVPFAFMADALGWEVKQEEPDQVTKRIILSQP
ncbi:copper amine oxidase N-terminal domain-containing protein [Paenibacillus spongiae]|uniref:Copper amine oxidase N-terminal domain-containing protein n=1 Tax=Paenibacillus spongiae TaxID=2909671 RepID=A0ABY5SEA2_9BACL|nr:copper amine oxidase N-terminal domain-containing protein [Paenibacillus spongiae]UVI30840.1 copper amine oxidase N-terminal domain-containing protein [Paenibacillus spongiae]